MTEQAHKILAIATATLNTLAQIFEHSKSFNNNQNGWSDELVIKELKEFKDNLYENLKKIDVSKLQNDDLALLRFGHWENNIYLCPAYLHRFEFPDKDNEFRFGCSAYGYKLIDGKLIKLNHSALFDSEEHQEQVHNEVQEIIDNAPKIPIEQAGDAIEYLISTN